MLKYKKAWQAAAPRVFVPFDPEYTMTYQDVYRVTGFNNKSIRPAMRDGTFPSPKHFSHTNVRFHPDHVEAWLRCRSLGEDWVAA